MAVSKTALGERIKQIRKQKGLSQAKVAEIACVDPKSLSRIESGAFHPSIETLQGLAMGLQVEMQDFFATTEGWVRLQRGYTLELISKATDSQIIAIAAALEKIINQEN